MALKGFSMYAFAAEKELGRSFYDIVWEYVQTYPNFPAGMVVAGLILFGLIILLSVVAYLAYRSGREFSLLFGLVKVGSLPSPASLATQPQTQAQTQIPLSRMDALSTQAPLDRFVYRWRSWLEDLDASLVCCLRNPFNNWCHSEPEAKNL